MIYFIIFMILLFDFVVFKMASNCSRWEEEYYLKEEKNESSLKRKDLVLSLLYRYNYITNEEYHNALNLVELLNILYH